MATDAPAQPAAHQPAPDELLETPPVAERRPVVLRNHGDERTDDWAWLRDRDDEAVIAHLRAENAHTRFATLHLDPLRTHLFEEIRSRIVETDLSVPTKKGPWWYFSRTREGADYGIHCRLPVQAEGRDPDEPPVLDRETAWPDEQVVLDENALAEGHPYLGLGSLSVSPDHDRLVYGTDTTGDERFDLRFRDLTTGEDFDAVIPSTSYGATWSADGTTAFYTKADAANRPHQIWRHTLGTAPGDDVLVFEEPDERFHLGVGRTKDEAYVVISANSKVTSEVRFVDAADPTGPMRTVAPRRQGVEYGVEHHHGTLLMLTNDGAEDFRLLAAPAAAVLASPADDAAVDDAAVDDAAAAPAADPSGPWVEIVPARPHARLDGVEVFDEFLVLSERADGMPRLRVVPLGVGAHDGDDHVGNTAPGSAEPLWSAPLPEGWVVPVTETPSSSWVGANPEPASRTLRWEYSSLVTPRTVGDLDLRTQENVVRKRQEVLGGYDQEQYVSERLWATALDGAQVPISVVRRRDVAVDGTAPCLLYGYGAYEHSIDPVFSSIRLSLLDRGVVFAIAHIRGGGEKGRRWYEEGKFLAKLNTFGDYLACARHLVAGGWADPARLVARGGSAGGLLMGAVANLAPELFTAVVAEVPFVDCLTTMLDETLPLTVIEWEEWGNPGADAEVYAAMKAYSPYDNVRPVRYPSVLATAGLEDPRVGFWEPAKWVQKLRAAHPENKVLLKTELEAGHGGPSGRYDAWRDEAFVLSFVLDAFGLARTPAAPESRPGEGQDVGEGVNVR